MSRPESIKNNTFCPTPWIHASTDSIGYLRVCCICNVSPFSALRKESGVLYNGKKDLIPRNHKLYKEMRAAMISNVRHPLCGQCWEKEKAGLLSQRQINTTIFYTDVMEKAFKLTQKDGTINANDFPIRYYDLRLGNKCNCRCTICSPSNSSMWDGGRVTDWSAELDTPYLKDLIKNLKYADRFYLTGGEPTIVKNNWKLIQLMIDQGHNEHIDLVFNINCVVLTKKMLDIWGKFKGVGLGFSVDGIGEIYEQIRIPAKWETTKKHILLFEEYSHPNTYGAFTLTISSVNILNIIDLFKWCINQKFTKIAKEFHFNLLVRPSDIDIRHIDLEQKRVIVKKYEEFYKWIDENLSPEDIDRCKGPFQGMINTIMVNENETI